MNSIANQLTNIIITDALEDELKIFEIYSTGLITISIMALIMKNVNSELKD